MRTTALWWGLWWGLAGCGASADGGDAGVDMALVSNEDDLAVSLDLAAQGNVTGAPILGTKVAVGAFDIYGITSDDQVIAIDRTDATLTAIAATGGSAQPIAAHPGSAPVIRGPMVMVWESVDSSSGAGTLDAWSASLGKVVITSHSLAGVADSDGAYLFYTDNTAADGNSTDLYVAQIDGANATRIAAGSHVGLGNGDTPCLPVSRFLSGGKLIVSHCPAPSDGSAGGREILVVDAATGALLGALAGNPSGELSTDRAGTRLFFTDPANHGFLLQANALHPPVLVSVDPRPIDEGFVLPDGSGVVFRALDPHPDRDAGSDGHVLVRAGFSQGSIRGVTTLVTGHVARILHQSSRYQGAPAVSPGGDAVLFATEVDPFTGASDVQLASILTPGQPTSLVADKRGALFGSAFTTDNRFVVFFGDSISAPAGLIGKLSTLSTGGGGASATRWTRSSGWSALGATGSKLVWNDGYGNGPFHGQADLYVGDVSQAQVESDGGATGATLIARQAEVDFFLTAGHDKVAFSVTGIAEAGLYVYAIP